MNPRLSTIHPQSYPHCPQSYPQSHPALRPSTQIVQRLPHVVIVDQPQEHPPLSEVNLCLMEIPQPCAYITTEQAQNLRTLRPVYRSALSSTARPSPFSTAVSSYADV